MGETRKSELDRYVQSKQPPLLFFTGKKTTVLMSQNIFRKQHLFVVWCEDIVI